VQDAPYRVIRAVRRNVAMETNAPRIRAFRRRPNERAVSSASCETVRFVARERAHARALKVSGYGKVE